MGRAEDRYLEATSSMPRQHWSGLLNWFRVFFFFVSEVKFPDQHVVCVFFFFSPGPNEDIPVKVSGNVRNGFEAEFLPSEVGLHTVLVEYNGVAVGGTPFFAKAFDAAAVAVSDVPRANPGKTVTFAGRCRKKKKTNTQPTSLACGFSDGSS